MAVVGPPLYGHFTPELSTFDGIIYVGMIDLAQGRDLGQKEIYTILKSAVEQLIFEYGLKLVGLLGQVLCIRLRLPLESVTVVFLI